VTAPGIGARLLCRLEELADPGSREFRIGGGEWPLRGLLVRVGASVQAFVNRCPHAGHPLNLLPDAFLTPDGAHVICRSHGALFDPATGHCIAGPCAGAALQRIPIEVIGGEVRLADGVVSGAG
jgi:nitrite reductase/ring-hydroxylating ferredoxin subunit